MEWGSAQLPVQHGGALGVSAEAQAQPQPFQHLEGKIAGQALPVSQGRMQQGALLEEQLQPWGCEELVLCYQHNLHLLRGTRTCLPSLPVPAGLSRMMTGWRMDG